MGVLTNKDIRTLESEFGILGSNFVSNDEEKEYKRMVKQGEELPEDVFKNSNGYYCRNVRTELSSDEIDRYLLLKKISILNTIKNCVIFFVVLAIIGIIAGIYYGVQFSTMLSQFKY